VLDDSALIAAVREREIGLTVCPTLMQAEIPGRMEFRAKAVKRMLELGLLVTINSDDPGLMRGLLVGDLMWRVHQAVGLTRAEVLTLAENSFRSAWLPPTEKDAYLASVRDFAGK
jgi:adenosine deaminase